MRKLNVITVTVKLAQLELGLQSIKPVANFYFQRRKGFVAALAVHVYC
jgi:hypothetical protein